MGRYEQWRRAHDDRLHLAVLAHAAQKTHSPSHRAPHRTAPQRITPTSTHRHQRVYAIHPDATPSAQSSHAAGQACGTLRNAYLGLIHSPPPSAIAHSSTPPWPSALQAARKKNPSCPNNDDSCEMSVGERKQKKKGLPSVITLLQHTPSCSVSLLNIRLFAYSPHDAPKL